MTARPAPGTFNTDDDLEEGELRQAHEDANSASAEMIGGSGVQDLVIASGIITPAAGASGTLRVDTEGAAATDNLDNIDLANVEEGRHLLIIPKDAGHVVTLRHNTGAATGRFSLLGSLALELNSIDQWIEVRREGTTVYEVRRGGREKEHVIGVGGDPAYQNSWAAGESYGIRYWKDDSGFVRLSGSATKSAVTVAVSVVCTLPAGYRPAYPQGFPVSATVGGTDEINMIFVQTNGEVQWLRSAGAPSSVSVTVRTAPVGFRATQ